ncbi:hypothetical protein [Methylobacterium sp. AMS5]|uniref:hypothetical protein n=1 Tax=Methylobacterium sp. AMS5 TaxID=925818 RepID=UPI00074FA2F1|nr:hypothetical protein [Methylobacterium sp. AMS5]AMB48326.1 hypothetical protein Y590_25495 [Methylobacterium sp. AMS5]
MAAIFYADNKSGEGVKIDVWRMNGTKAYLRHYENYLMLDFIAKSTKDREEQRRARVELTMCEKKLEFWKRHPKYDHDEAKAGVAKLKAMWEGR